MGSSSLSILAWQRVPQRQRDQRKTCGKPTSPCQPEISSSGRPVKAPWACRCSFISHDRGQSQQTTKCQLLQFLYLPQVAAGFCLLRFMAHVLGCKSLGIKELSGIRSYQFQWRQMCLSKAYSALSLARTMTFGTGLTALCLSLLLWKTVLEIPHVTGLVRINWHSTYEVLSGSCVKKPKLLPAPLPLSTLLRTFLFLFMLPPSN